MLEELFIKSEKFVKLNNLQYKRYFINIHMQDDNAMLVGIPQRTFLNNS